MADQWSSLLEELLDFIGKRLTLYADYVRFRAVCVSWRSVLPKKPSHQPYQFPLLMLSNNDERNRRGFFSLQEKKGYELQLPELEGKLCCGSSHGWVVTMEQNSPAMYLINPFTRAQIPLPPLSSFPGVLEYRADKVNEEYSVLMGTEPEGYTFSSKEFQNFFIDKIVLSSSPSSSTGSDYIAMAIYGEFSRLAFCRSGDKSWTFVFGERTPHSDVIFYRDKFYASRAGGEVVVLEVHGNSAPQVTQILPRPQELDTTHMNRYLVDSSEELLMAARSTVHLSDSHYKTIQFMVFKLNHSSSGSGDYWSQVKNLGDRMLFVGLNSSMCFSSLDFPGCRGNCIYFTDDYFAGRVEHIRGGYDLGVFNLENGSIEPLPDYTGGRDTQPIWPLPVWVTPNPC